MRSLLLTLPLALSGCALFQLAAIRKSHPVVPDTALPVAGIADRVEITRDDLGVPHVRASSAADAWYGLGFAHGQDRWFQADFSRHLMYGDLSSWLGPRAADLDVFMRQMDLRSLASARFDDQSDEAKQAMVAYAAGMNAGVASLRADPIELRLLGVEPEPWEASDAYSILFLMGWGLAENPQVELAAFLARDHWDTAMLDRLFRYDEHIPPADPAWDALRKGAFGDFTPGFAAFSGALGGRPDAAMASNNWVIGPERSATGAPILANDPHLGQGVPSLWYVADVQGGDVHAAGATLAGLPGVVIGHNARAAWGLTNVMADVVDFAVLPYADGSVTLNGVSTPLDERTIQVVVDGETIRESTVYDTPIGPVVTEVSDAVDHVLVMQWHALTVPDRSPTVLQGLARMQTVTDGYALGREPMAIAQNTALADVDGGWGYQSVGSVPVRAGHTGRVPYDASVAGSGWTGFMDALPGADAPEAGWVHTANARPRFDRPAFDPDHPGVDVDAITSQWVPPHRHRRLDELLGADGPFDVARVDAIQRDVLDVVARDGLPGWLEGVAPEGEVARACLAELTAWDHRMEAGSRGAAVWSRFQQELVVETLRGQIPDASMPVYLSTGSPARSILDGPFEDWLASHPDGRVAVVERALRAACLSLQGTLGDDVSDWTWGELHPLALTHPFAEGRKILSKWNRPVVPYRGSGSTVAAAGYGFGVGERPVGGMQSLRFVVSMDDVSEGWLAHPGGQSGHPRHPDADTHWEDWVDGRLTPLWFDDADVAAHAAGTWVLTPE